MRSRTAFLLLSVMLFLSAVLVFGISEHNAATQSSPHLEKPSVIEKETELLIFEDLEYGKHENQTLDLNLPVDNREEVGLVVFLHGGGWLDGDKSASKSSYEVYHANKDYATASINYRFINDGKSNVEHIIEDITLALEYIKSYAADYSVNINKVILGGHSAGGHLSLLYAYKHKDISPIEPVGVFTSAPVPDLALELFFTDNLLGDEQYMCDFISQLCGTTLTPENRASRKAFLDKYSPINYVSYSTVPTIVVHGSGDRVAPYSGSLKLMKKLRKYRINHELIVFENTGHSLRGNEDKKQYASELMLTCAKTWFGVTEKTNKA